jgi:hypothetical protein
MSTVLDRSEGPAAPSDAQTLLEVSGFNAWYGAAHVLFDLSVPIVSRRWL